MTTILRALRKTDEARRAAKAARTQLGRLSITPEHREAMRHLEALVVQLEAELARLRYQAQHGRAA